MKRVFILGATGSIGKSSVEVVRNYSSKLKIVGLSANYNDKELSDLGNEFNVKNLVLTGKPQSKYGNILNFGMDSLLKMIEESNADIVLNGIAGSSGLLPSISAIKSGKDLALANKETMVMAGDLVNDLVKQHGVKLLPVDSEHSAIFHLLEHRDISDISEIILTASGGAFRDLNKEELKNVTLKDALKHPTWNMGNKITIDSASMANKGLEVIEAFMLFKIPLSKIKVLIHPQSYVHSLIRTKDLSMYAQISAPDMKLPIQNALTYPQMEIVESTFLDLAGKSLTFDKPDFEKYQMLKLAYSAMEKGNAYTIAYNATNEVLVDEFVKGNIQFIEIPKYTEQVLLLEIDITPNSVEHILQIDSLTRERTYNLLRS